MGVHHTSARNQKQKPFGCFTQRAKILLAGLQNDPFALAAPGQERLRGCSLSLPRSRASAANGRVYCLINQSKGEAEASNSERHHKVQWNMRCSPGK